MSALVALPVQSATPELPDWVVQDHFDQVRRINRQLAILKNDVGLGTYYSNAIAPTAYNRSALVLPDDADAAQIIFRRTRALLDELRNLAPGAAAGFEGEMADLRRRLEAIAPLVVPFPPPPVAEPAPAARSAKSPGPDKNTSSIDPVFLPDISEDNATLRLNLSAFDELLAPAKGKSADKKAPAARTKVVAPKAPPAAQKEEKSEGPKMDELPPDLRQIVKADGREPQVDPMHPRIALAMDVLALQRRIALANPLLGDGDLLLCRRSVSGGGGHIASQYKTTSGNAESGLFRLSGHLTNKPVAAEVLGGATVASGRLAGQPLDSAARAAANLQPGAFGWPDLRWDAKQIVFSWKEHSVCDHGSEDTVAYFNGTGVSQYSRDRCFHIFAFDLDTADPGRLRMLTDGSGNDGHPVYLPNGRIVFVSDRRGGVERCGGPSRATSLHSMSADGTDQVALSSHETSEFSPSVHRDGRIIYGRWDYVDRGDCIAHHIWTSYPDGRDPRAPHGNYFMGKFRPDAETEFQPIPGDQRIIAVAAAHHYLGHRGSLIVLDLDRPDDDSMSQVFRFTPDIPFPETREPDPGQRAGALACPWPLSRNFVLAGTDSGPVLVDAFGNRTLLWKTTSGLPTLEVIPLRKRARPVEIPHMTASGVPGVKVVPPESAPRTGIFTVVNVYNSLMPWPAGVNIVALRIVKIYPRANTIWMNWPDVGVATESLVRGVVGTVPVEKDGSAQFEVPADTLVYFQALDESGRAVQTMRSGTYLQPGAGVTCQGCHEPKHQSPPMPGKPLLAVRRPPSVPSPGPADSDPVFYPTLVQPVLEKNCVSCHSKAIGAGKRAPDLSATPLLKAGGDADVLHSSHGSPTRWTVSYENLSRYTGRNFGGRPVKYEGRTRPGTFGAMDSKLYPLLAGGKHHDVRLSDEEMARIVVWMDLNSNFLGHYLFTEEQSRGILPASPPQHYPDTSDNAYARIPVAHRREGGARVARGVEVISDGKKPPPSPRSGLFVPSLDDPGTEPGVSLE